jgi:hypothetical protein
MSVLETIRCLATGTRPMGGLLHTARLSALGVEAYGEEAVVESFRAAPLELSNAATIIEAPRHLAIFDGEIALFADVGTGGIARLWWLSAAEPVPDEAGIAVVFNPDLTQARGDVFFAASDHPALAIDAETAVMRAGRALTHDPAEVDRDTFRARAFVTRAFGDASGGAVLFAVYRLTGGPTRQSGFAMAAAHWNAHGMEIVRDKAGEEAIALRDWTPRIPA